MSIIPSSNPYATPNSEPPEQIHVLGLSALFGLFYFIQGITEPTEGLISQPVRSLLKEWGQDAAQIAAFSALLALPWSIKPVYGLISDFIPLAGYYRKSYLILASGIASVSLATLYLRELPVGATASLLGLLLLPTIAVAFSDVVVDALMVEKGQPRGLTGRLQSVQWTAIWAAAILTGTLGGYLSQTSQQQLGFLICAALTGIMLVLSLTIVSERRASASRDDLAATWAALKQSGRSRIIFAVGAFLFLWNFNPFSITVLYLHMTRSMHFSEQFYGNTVTLGAIGAMAGSLLYGLYCRRVRMSALVHLSVVLGILSTLTYWLLRDETSAALIKVAFDFATATATMIQLDLAARVCPPRAAATMFAILTALTNFSESLSTWLGGVCYESILETAGDPLAFNVLVGIGAAVTACCWFVVPFLKREGVRD